MSSRSLIAVLVLVMVVCGCFQVARSDGIPFYPDNCTLSASNKEMIREYKPIVEEIVTAITRGFYKGKTLKELTKWVDKFGDRMTGSEALEKSIDYLRDYMQEIPGYRFVHTEDVIVPKWLRGPEWAQLIEPWEKPIDIMGYHFSVSTNPLVLTAEVVLCYVDNDITLAPKKFLGKVVANAGNCNTLKLASAGAKAVLTESGIGLYTVHTGRKMYYNTGSPRIPVASVTREDMTMFDRISKLGKKIVVRLSMKEPETINVTSRNLIGEYLGRTTSNMRRKYVGVSSHMDSWDVGQGAQDDAFGVFMGILMIHLFDDLNLRPRRTIRSMFWTGEELGLLGSKAYAVAHAQELIEYQAVFEADVGVEVTGLLYHGSHKFGCWINEIVNLVRMYIPNVTLSYRPDWRSDLNNFAAKQVPTLGLPGGPHYRWFTHSNADTVTSIRSSQLDRQFAVYAAVAYVVADMRVSLPRLQAPTRASKS